MPKGRLISLALSSGYFAIMLFTLSAGMLNNFYQQAAPAPGHLLLSTIGVAGSLVVFCLTFYEFIQCLRVRRCISVDNDGVHWMKWNSRHSTPIEKFDTAELLAGGMVIESSEEKLAVFVPLDDTVSDAISANRLLLLAAHSAAVQRALAPPAQVDVGQKLSPLSGAILILLIIVGLFCLIFIACLGAGVTSKYLAAAITVFVTSGLLFLVPKLKTGATVNADGVQVHYLIGTTSLPMQHVANVYATHEGVHVRTTTPPREFYIGGLNVPGIVCNRWLKELCPPRNPAAPVTRLPGAVSDAF